MSAVQNVVSNSMRVLVTGGGAGIGLGIVETLLEEGHSVCAADLSFEEGLRPVGERHWQVRMDVSSSASVKSACAAAVEGLGGLDAVVNNAGIGGPRKSIDDLTDEEWRSVFAVNVDGPFFVIRACLEHLEKSGNPSIVNVSTASTRIGIPMRSPYVASKMALVGLNRGLTRELGPKGIRCNTVHPGVIENDRGNFLMEARAKRMGLSFDEAMEYRLGFISMRTRIRPTEIGSLVGFLIGPGSRHVTGQEIFIDGNMEWED